MSKNIIKTFSTDKGDAVYDYESLANKPIIYSELSYDSCQLVLCPIDYESQIEGIIDSKGQIVEGTWLITLEMPLDAEALGTSKVLVTNHNSVGSSAVPQIHFYGENGKYLGYKSSKGYTEETPLTLVKGVYGTVIEIPEGTKSFRLQTTSACKYYNLIYYIIGDPVVKNTFEDPSYLTNETILCFGDSIIGNYGEQAGAGASIPWHLSKLLNNADVKNCGFGGCWLTLRTDDWGVFSMVALAEAIANGDFSAQEAATVAPSNKDLHIANMKNTDFNRVKFITIAYGTNDFNAKSSLKIDNTENPYDQDSIKGAYRYVIETIQGTYPNITIIPCSMIRKYDANNNFEPKVISKSGLTMEACNQAIKEVAEEYGLPYIDNYNIGSNKFTARNNFHPSNDGTHPNQVGRFKMAANIAGTIKKLCGV